LPAPSDDLRGGLRGDLRVDLQGFFGHISNSVIRAAGRVTRDDIAMNGGQGLMDTKSLDKQGKHHLKIYENVLFAAKICIVAIIATLVIMAATLV
jgi:hypothetical protein